MKKMNFSQSMAFLFAMLFFGNAMAQNAVTAKIWTQINQSEVIATGERYTIPRVCKTLRMDKTEMQNLLRQAPMEPAQTANLSNGLLIELPMPDGSYQRFEIFEYSVMHPDLAAKFPGIKTYTGKGVDDESAVVKLDLTQWGFHSMVRSPRGSFFIDPYNQSTTTDYICYDKKDLQRTSTFVCEQSADEEATAIIQNNQALRTNGTQLRTYRLALACTGEYAAFFGGTVSGAQAGMATTLNRVNGVYESELSVRMILVANNNLLVYTNSATDPYTNGSGGTMLGENQTTCTNVIGSANYDIGHVVSTGGGGVAGLGVVCSSSNKARGVTGSGSPTGDGFDIDYVAHEMGHQFAGNHTFNSVTGSCNGNRSAGAAFEPGSGITIQAYAGICGSDNLASNSIAYFHGYSLDEMITFITTGGGNSCPVITSTGNTPPVVTSMAYNCSIPISTPFELTGGATDANGDPLTYSWEERDLGTAGAWNTQSTTAPQFRTFIPVTSPSRTFPKLSDIINNTTTIGELLPNQARTLKFRLTARDNRAGGGGIMHPDTNVTITVVNTGAAFAVTAPNTAVTWAGGSTQTVTWNVSGTTANGINTANVKISLSTDGGNTFPTILLASTANDGTESITVPNTATTTARVKVEAVGNIFFDMSNTNFTITASSGLTSISTSTISPLAYCAGASLNVAFTTNGSANAGNVFRAVLSNASGSFANADTIGALTSTTAGTITCQIPAGAASGTGYRIRVVSSNPVVTGSDNGSNITINLNPTPSITGATSFCAGGSTTLNAGAGYSSYSWSTGATTQSINVNTAGTFTVTVSNASGCTGSANATTTVNANPTPSISGATSFCAGGSTTLNAGAGYSSYLWSTGAISQTINVSTAGTFTVTVSNASGCTGTANATTIVNANPTPSISGATSFCAGGSTTLNAGAGYSSYSWNTGATTQSINVNTAGTFTVTVSNASGCTGTANATTIVNANPTPSISGATSFCAGGSTTLNAGAGYSSYSWSTGATTQSINVNTAGTFTVIVSNASGCTGSASVTTSVGTFSASITPAGPITICSGTSTVLSATAGTGYTYKWYRNNVLLTATAANFTTSTAGTYKCVVTAGTCTATTANVVVNVINNPTPTITASGPLSFCNGGSVTFTANTFAGVVYQWEKNNVAIAGATSQTYTATTTGTYRAKETANGCSKYTPKKSVTVTNCARFGNTTLNSDAENTGAGISAYPNPFNDRLKLEIPSFNDQQIEIKVVDVLGKDRYKKMITTNSTEELEVKLPAGIYMITTVVDGQTKSIRVVKAK